MAIQIKVDDNAYQQKLITLNGQTLFITVSFNTRDNRWYVDVSDRNEVDLITGIKLLPNQNLTSKYVSINSLIGGNLYCVNIKGDGIDITRDNFGTDRQFQLWYISSSEENDISELTV